MDTKKRLPPRAIRQLVSIGLVLLTGGLLIWKGPTYFVNSSDPVFFRNLVYGITTVGVLVFLWQIYKSRNNTPLLAVIRPALLIALVMGITVLAGNYLVGFMGVTTDKNCEQLFELADRLSQEKDLQGAESLLNQCIAQTKAPRYTQQAEVKLARIYVSEVSVFTEQGVCRKDYFAERLSRALNLASKHNESDLVSLIQEKIKSAEQICNATIATTPNPTTDQYEIDVLRTETRNDSAIVDIRVVKNHDEQVLDLSQDNFTLWDGTQKINLQGFSARHSDDPVCIVAVVDNSGSITDNDGLTKIRSAIQVLNTLRKPNDEIGLVLFGNVNNVRAVRNPYPYNLSEADLANINGQDDITALWLGVQKGLDVADKCQSSDRYLIVLTDGRDNTNFGDPFKAARDFSSMAQEKGTNICVVGIQSAQLDESPLYLLATGCNYFKAASLSEPSGGDLLAGQFQDIVGYVRDFYRFEFSPQYFDKGKQLYIQLAINDVFVLEKQLNPNVSP